MASDREIIIPKGMEDVVARRGYAPAVRVGDVLYCVGQIGRAADFTISADPLTQFRACWDNLERVLKAAGCSFADVVDLTTYHLELDRYFATFRQAKDEVFPKGLAGWTVLGVAALAAPGALVEIKAIAHIPRTSAT